MIYLRPLTPQDHSLTMAWRSNSLVYEGFYQQNRPLTWDEHINWYATRGKNWQCFIIMYEQRPVGVIIVQQLDHWMPEIGWYIGEVSLWGKGIGKQAVQLGLDHLRSMGYEYCHTSILDTGTRSLRLAESVGFKVVGEAREGETEVKIKL